MTRQRNAARNAMTRRSLLASGTAGALLTIGGARAQSFPSGPVKIVVAVGPGSSPDVIGRIVADQLTRIWGQQALIINQPGASGGIAIRAVGHAAPDGHTLYLALATNFIALPETQANLPFDVARDFVPIGFIGEQPMLIAASPALGVNTINELIVYAKKHPGALNVAAGNRGSILHFTAEWLRTAIGVDMTLLHYPAAPQAIADVLGGRVQLMVDAASSIRGAINSGQIKPLAIASLKRIPNFPDLPTVAETIPGFEGIGWLALVAPPGTPKPIAQKISDDLRTVVTKPEVKDRLADLGTYIRPMSPAELTSFIRNQQKIWRPVIAKTAKTLK